MQHQRRGGLGKIWFVNPTAEAGRTARLGRWPQANSMSAAASLVTCARKTLSPALS